MSSNFNLPPDNGQTPSQIPPLAGTSITPSAFRDPDFRDSLRKRSIFINRTDASTELVERAKKTITNNKSSPEMDDALSQELAFIVRNLETEDLVEELGRVLIPTKKKVPHQSLQHISNRLWFNPIAIPLDPNRLAIPLPKPKPDLVFGYSETAFDTNQSMAINRLVGQLRQNYAMPGMEVRFPFLIIEFKSRETGGTHFIATNELANAGAVAMEGTLQLARRISAEENIDLDEPQIFSLSIDNVMAFVNVHWLSRNAKSGAFLFHTNHLLGYFLDADGLKAVDRAVKNILDYDVNKRLEKIRGELDIYTRKGLRRWTKVVWHPIHHQRSSSNRCRYGKGNTPTHWQTGNKRREESAPVEPEDILQMTKSRKKRKRVQILQPLDSCRFHGGYRIA